MSINPPEEAYILLLSEENVDAATLPLIFMLPINSLVWKKQQTLLIKLLGGTQKNHTGTKNNVGLFCYTYLTLFFPIVKSSPQVLLLPSVWDDSRPSLH